MFQPQKNNRLTGIRKAQWKYFYSLHTYKYLSNAYIYVIQIYLPTYISTYIQPYADTRFQCRNICAYGEAITFKRWNTCVLENLHIEHHTQEIIEKWRNRDNVSFYWHCKIRDMTGNWQIRDFTECCTLKYIYTYIYLYMRVEIHICTYNIWYRRSVSM